MAITVTVDDVSVNRTAIGAEGPFTINIPGRDLPVSESGSDLALVRLSVDGSFQPSRFLQSADTRNLSIRLSSVGFSGETPR